MKKNWLLSCLHGYTRLQKTNMAATKMLMLMSKT